MGARYVARSYPVLLALLIPFVISRAEDPTRRILYGMARHQYIAYVRVVEGFMNVVLSVLLARRFGIVGVAIGTAIPMTLTAIFIYPVHVCRMLEVPLTQYVYEGFRHALAFCIPLVGVLLALKHAFPAPGYTTLAIQAGGGGLVYGSLLLWFFLTRDPLGAKLRTRLLGYMRHATSR
jgi:O-antigen/teichoic acid export membrane protein